MSNRVNFLSVLVVTLLLSACASKTPAPVEDRRPATPPTESQPTTLITTPVNPVAATADEGKTHTVQKGETLYAIAFQNNLDYRELAIWNNIENLHVIKVGAVLRLSPPAVLVASPQPRPSEPVVTPLSIVPMPSASTERPAQNSAILKIEPKAGKVPYTDQTLAKLEHEAGSLVSSTTPAAPTPAVTPPAPVVAAVVDPAANEGVDWAWPVKGALVSQFTELNKGIDIAGSRGTAIHAAANGTVIHTGAGIRGYGRLVIIKHGLNWVSAYAHNEKIIVTEGMQVRQGQKIAEMGNSDTDNVKLHFEIRKQGKPVNPAKFLPAK